MTRCFAALSKLQKRLFYNLGLRILSFDLSNSPLDFISNLEHDFLYRTFHWHSLHPCCLCARISQWQKLPFNSSTCSTFACYCKMRGGGVLRKQLVADTWMSWYVSESSLNPKHRAATSNSTSHADIKSSVSGVPCQSQTLSLGPPIHFLLTFSMLLALLFPIQWRLSLQRFALDSPLWNLISYPVTCLTLISPPSPLSRQSWLSRGKSECRFMFKKSILFASGQRPKAFAFRHWYTRSSWTSSWLDCLYY